MPDVLQPFHGDEPMQNNDDRPYVLIGADQLRRIAEVIADRPEKTVRLDYGGHGYWFVRPIDPNTGEPVDNQIVWSIEPRHL